MSVIDTQFQTLEKNEAAEAELALGWSILQTAAAVYVAAVQKAFPPGCVINKVVGPRRHSVLRLIRYYNSDATLAECINERTGQKKTVEMGVGYLYRRESMELVTYAYRLVDVEAALEKRGSVTYDSKLGKL